MSAEITVCSWRIVKGDPSGMMMWFDPTCEEPRLVRLPCLQEEAPHDGDLFFRMCAQRERLDKVRVGPLEGGDGDDRKLPF